MKSTKNKIDNVAQIKALIEASAPKVHELKYGEAGNELIVKVYPVLQYTQRTEMVREIASGVFMGEKKTVDAYVPEFLTLLQKYTTIKFFTDLTLPVKLDDMWLLLNYTSIYDDVIKIVGAEQVNDIFDAANKTIDTYRRYLAAKTDVNALMDKVIGAVKEIEGKISQEDISAITAKIIDITKGAAAQNIMGA